MKKLISIVLCLALALTLVACGGASASKMTMGTGGTTGTYYGYGGGCFIPENRLMALREGNKLIINTPGHWSGHFGISADRVDGGDALLPILQQMGGDQRLLGRKVVIHRSHADPAGLGHRADGHGSVTCLLDLPFRFFNQSAFQIFDDFGHKDSFCEHVHINSID